MSPQRVIRPAARRSPAGAGSLLWTAAAAALPVVVTVLVLAAVTLAVLVFSGRGFDSLFAVVAVEWLVVNRVPLTVDEIELGFLPLVPPLIYVALLARQTRAVLTDVEQPGPREAGAAVAGVTLAGAALTVLASLLAGSAASDFAVRASSLPAALAWTVAVAVIGAGIGVWLFFRREIREGLPLWVRGGVHLGVAFVASLWAVSALLVTAGVLFAWEPVGSVLEIGKGLVGTAALAAISAAYLPNVVAAATALLVGGEAHLGEASFSVFAVSRGPLPEVPLAAALPTTDPHWVVQGLLLVTVVVAAVLSRSVAHWFRTTGDAVRAAWLAAAIVALVMVATPVVAGGQLGLLGTVGTGALIAAGMGLVIFGVIGSATVALSLAGLTRRRERAESELERRRRRAGVAVPGPGGEGAEHQSEGFDSSADADADADDDADDDADADADDDADGDGDDDDGGGGDDDGDPVEPGEPEGSGDTDAAAVDGSSGPAEFDGVAEEGDDDPEAGDEPGPAPDESVDADSESSGDADPGPVGEDAPGPRDADAPGTGTAGQTAVAVDEPAEGAGGDATAETDEPDPAGDGPRQ